MLTCLSMVLIRAGQAVDSMAGMQAFFGFESERGLARCGDCVGWWEIGAGCGDVVGCAAYCVEEARMAHVCVVEVCRLAGG